MRDGLVAACESPESECSGSVRIMMRLISYVTALAVLPVFAAAQPATVLPGESAGQGEAAVTVSQRGRAFDPEETTLTEGGTLTIINDDQFLHHAFVESDSLSFDSGSQPIGSRTDIVFDQPGEYVVRCDIHPKMRLEVTVLPD